MIPEIETLEREIARTGVSRKFVAGVIGARYSTLLDWCLGRKIPSEARRAELRRVTREISTRPDRSGLVKRRAIRGRPRVFCEKCGDRMREWRSGRPSDRLCEACLVEGRGVGDVS
jgi:hypothetical protein